MADIEFLIHEVRIEGDVVLASGIVNKGRINLGTSFTCVTREASGSHEVQLSVQKLVAYRREISELPTGMSGEITLLGRGMSILVRHDMLEA